MSSWRAFIRSIGRHLTGDAPHQIVDLTEGSLLIRGGESRLNLHNLPIEVVLGSPGKRLLIYPDPVEVPPHRAGFDAIGKDHPVQTQLQLLIVEPNRFFSDLAGFIRLMPGEKITLGGHDDDQMARFNYPPSVESRHAVIHFDGNTVAIRDLHTTHGTKLVRIQNQEQIDQLDHWRRKNLQQMDEIYPSDVGPLERHDAFQLISQVNAIMADEAHRPPDSRGKPGGVVTLPTSLTPVFIGDLHARLENLRTLLTQTNILATLASGRTALVILGDAVHSERKLELEDMDSSLEMMDLIFTLKTLFPKQVFYIKGNHDAFSHDVVKGGVSQGVLWDKHVRFQRGAEYRNALETFYASLPCVVLGESYVACHAAPPKRSVTLETLINLHDYPGIEREVTWNRMRRPTYPTGYVASHVRAFRQSLDLPKTAPFIVAHNPLSRGEKSVWIDAGEICHHHIVFSALQHNTAMMAQIRNVFIPLIFPIMEPPPFAKSRKKKTVPA
ncbi:MAG: metallophosphoesterase [Magnetococcales bacterium]|nr:metallophosphoesterase [Magnetococcales bacterium]